MVARKGNRTRRGRWPEGTAVQLWTGHDFFRDGVGEGNVDACRQAYSDPGIRAELEEIAAQHRGGTGRRRAWAEIEFE